MRLGATREVIHDALSWGWQQRESSMVQYLTYLTRIEKSIKASEPCGDFLEAAFICAAINSLGIVGSWLKFAYGPEDSLILQADLARELRNELPGTSAKRHIRLMSLAMTTLEDYRLSVWNHQRNLPRELYCSRMGTDASHFERDWGYDHGTMVARCIAWDRYGVGNVGRMVHSLRGPTEPDNRPSEILRDIA